MKVFITGGAGLLGSQLLRDIPVGVNVAATYHENKIVPPGKKFSLENVDIREEKKLREILTKIKPQVIIHTAAKGSPDFCQFHQKTAWDINVVGTRNILAIAKDIDAKVLFTSTNQVFSGNNPPYSEGSRLDPVNFYGKTKVQTERDIQSSKTKAIIVRLMTMYGWGNPQGQKNTAMWVVDMLTNKKPIKVVDDIYNNFLWVGQASRALWELALGRKQIEKVNIAGAEIENRYNFAVKVAEEFKLDASLITPVHKNYFKDEAPRPMNTIYDISLFNKRFKTKAVTLREGLKEMHKQQKKTLWVPYEK